MCNNELVFSCVFCLHAICSSASPKKITTKNSPGKSVVNNQKKTQDDTKQDEIIELTSDDVDDDALKEITIAKYIFVLFFMCVVISYLLLIYSKNISRVKDKARSTSNAVNTANIEKDVEDMTYLADQTKTRYHTLFLTFFYLSLNC